MINTKHLPIGRSPSCLQVTVAAAWLHPELPHTGTQHPELHISTLPLVRLLAPLASRTLPSEHGSMHAATI